MTPNLTLVIVAGALIAVGVYLLTERAMTRILLGVLLASNGVSVLFLVAAGVAGRAPILGDGGVDPTANIDSSMSDPLPQAMVLTAIVITLGMVALLLTMAYRSFQLDGHDDVQDDVEDARIRKLAEQDEASDSYEDGGHDLTDEEGLRVSDEGGEE